MASRSTLVVLMLGLVAVVALSLLFKLAFESSPALAKVGVVKKAFADRFDASGLEEVSVRSLGRQKGFAIRATFSDLSATEPEGLSEELARCFLTHYPGAKPRKLKISLIQSRIFGCEGDALVYEGDFDLPIVAVAMRVEEAAEQIRGQMDAATGLQVVSSKSLMPDTMQIEVSPPQGEEISAQELEESLAELEAFIWKSLSGVPVRQVTLVVRSSVGSGAILKEVQIDRPRAQPPRRNLHFKRFTPPTEGSSRPQPR